jgi:hypothetical protein
MLESPGISASWKLRHRVSPKYRDRTKHRASSTPHLTSSQTERGPEPEPIGWPPPSPRRSIDPRVTGCWRVTQSVASRATSRNRDVDPGVTSRCEAGLAARMDRLLTEL